MRLQDAIALAYDRVIDTALENDVDFVVLAGDAFDTSRPSYGDYLHFFDGLERLHAAGIPLYLTPGNHDPLSTWRAGMAKLPPSAHMMGGEAPEFALYEREGEPLCLIGARGYRNQAWPLDESISAGISRTSAIRALETRFPHAARAPFSLGLIHTGLDLDQSKAFCNPGDLLAADIDYWACGHLHQRLTLPTYGNPRIVFPGCIQGRDLKESGERGCFIVSMNRTDEFSEVHTTLNFVPTANIAFHTISVDISTCQTLADVSRLTLTHLFHACAKTGCDDMVVRVVLEGESPLHRFLAKADVLADLRKRLNNAYPAFFCDTLLDRTRLPRQRRASIDGSLFPDHVLHIANEQRSHGDEMVNYIQDEFVKRGIDLPSSLARRMDDFNDAAETLVLDLLDEEAS